VYHVIPNIPLLRNIRLLQTQTYCYRAKNNTDMIQHRKFHTLFNSAVVTKKNAICVERHGKVIMNCY
jgi:hypothetical protein